jgi:hypothetical protein
VVVDLRALRCARLHPKEKQNVCTTACTLFSAPAFDLLVTVTVVPKLSSGMQCSPILRSAEHSSKSDTKRRGGEKSSNGCIGIVLKIKEKYYRM